MLWSLVFAAFWLAVEVFSISEKGLLAPELECINASFCAVLSRSVAFLVIL